MDVFLTIRRKKTTLFLSLKENAEVLEVKKMIEGILKVPVEDQLLIRQTTAMDDHKMLAHYGLNDQTARAHSPATLGLCFREAESGLFEQLDVAPYSNPPELPEVMRCQENQPPVTVPTQQNATATATADGSSRG